MTSQSVQSKYKKRFKAGVTPIANNTTSQYQSYVGRNNIFPAILLKETYC